MGSKQALSNGNELEELTDLLAAFEGQNSIKLLVTCSLGSRKGQADTVWVVSAVEGVEGVLVAPSSGFQSVKVWGGDFKTLMGLLTRLLYALDFQLALNEFERAPAKKA